MKSLEFYINEQNLLQKMPKVSTGYRVLDIFFEGEGFGAGEIITIGGRPAMGKTTFALNLSINMFSNMGKPVLYFSLNESASDLVSKILSIESTVSLRNLYRGKSMDKVEVDNVIKAMDRMKEIEISFHDSDDLKNKEIIQICSKYTSNNGVGAIIIDDLQNMNISTRDSVDFSYSELMNSLKRVGQALNCPILILSQLNRKLENRKNKRPRLVDLKGSSEIEYKSDIVLFIYRDEVYEPETNEPHVAEIIVAKNRKGEIGTCKLQFLGESLTFKNFGMF